MTSVITTFKKLQDYDIEVGDVSLDGLTISRLAISGNGVQANLSNIRLLPSGIAFFGTIQTPMGTIKGTGSTIPYRFIWSLLEGANVDPVELMNSILGPDWHENAMIMGIIQNLPDLYNIIAGENSKTRVGGAGHDWSKVKELHLTCRQGLCNMNMQFYR